MKVLTVIPARIGSTRFPRKPLAPILGKPMVRWVVEGALKSKLSEVMVATDSREICEVIDDLVPCEITPSDLPSGTDRVAFVASKFPHEIIVNLQGDEPLIDGKIIDELVNEMDDETEIVTPVKEVKKNEVESPGAVCVVTDRNGYALYFSRSIIPFYRERMEEKYLKHIGIYVFWRKSLLKFVSLPQGRLERIEKLEQLRALENGMNIKVVRVNYESIPVDYPEDIEKIERILKSSR